MGFFAGLTTVVSAPQCVNFAHRRLPLKQEKFTGPLREFEPKES